MSTKLECKVQKKIDSEIIKIFQANQIDPFPYDKYSTLKNIGMEDMDAADFLNNLEDTFNINVDELLKPLQEKATQRAREERERKKEKSIYAPEIPYQEIHVRMGELRDYIVIEVLAKEIEKFLTA